MVGKGRLRPAWEGPSATEWHSALIHKHWEVHQGSKQESQDGRGIFRTNTLLHYRGFMREKAGDGRSWVAGHGPAGWQEMVRNELRQ